MQCPVCSAVYRCGTSPQCRRCGLDLTPLINLADGAIACHRQAIRAFETQNYSLAAQLNQQALALHHSPGAYHSLAGQLRFLAGDFRGAISSWQRAQALGFPLAADFLQALETLTSNLRG